jgi:hypothetical protein
MARFGFSTNYEVGAQKKFLEVLARGDFAEARRRINTLPSPRFKEDNNGYLTTVCEMHEFFWDEFSKYVKALEIKACVGSRL